MSRLRVLTPSETLRMAQRIPGVRVNPGLEPLVLIDKVSLFGFKIKNYRISTPGQKETA